MDVKIIGDIVALATQTVAFIFTLSSLFISRIEKPTGSLDTPSLKILTIQRQKTDIQYINKTNFSVYNNQFFIILSVQILAIIISIIIIIYTSYLGLININITIILVFILILADFLIVLFYSYSIIRKLNTTTYDYLFFKNVSLIIESDFQYLFDKCIDVLRIMNLKIKDVELGDSGGTIKALRLNLLTEVRSVTVTVKKISNSESSYTVELEFPHESGHPNDISKTSKFTNSFIDRLISKSVVAR
jgi:hypothetical protein